MLVFEQWVWVWVQTRVWTKVSNKGLGTALD